MTEYSADDIRKAADVLDRMDATGNPFAFPKFSAQDLRLYAARLEAEAAAKARHDEHVEELARYLYEANPFSQKVIGWDGHAERLREDYREQARLILADGRWVRVEDGA